MIVWFSNLFSMYVIAVCFACNFSLSFSLLYKYYMVFWHETLILWLQHNPYLCEAFLPSIKNSNCTALKWKSIISYQTTHLHISQVQVAKLYDNTSHMFPAKVICNVIKQSHCTSSQAVTLERAHRSRICLPIRPRQRWVPFSFDERSWCPRFALVFMPISSLHSSSRSILFQLKLKLLSSFILPCSLFWELSSFPLSRFCLLSYHNNTQTRFKHFLHIHIHFSTLQLLHHAFNSLELELNCCLCRVCMQKHKNTSKM